ncbi:MAG: Hsp70 family protein [Kofleriaceae bacterium]|nr:Hsp70 family protein [Kofleriaceae bacterium]MBP9203741.1 Hsp70 family protein [Kofleriaceae bacterium]
MAARRDLVLGIDFGTSYSSAGALIDGRVELVVDDGEPMIPSVVYLPSSGPPQVGQRAVMRMLHDPQNTVTSVKRFMGLGDDEDAMRRFAASVPYNLRASGSQILLHVGGREYATEQIAGYVLTRLRELAEARFGATIERAVITVSAAAPVGYVESIRRAARIARLELVQIVSEPIAGALAFGLHGEPCHRRLVVCDFGGGTFDVTAVVQQGLKFQPVAAGGNAFLGGDDLDLAMANTIAGHIYKRSRFDALADVVRKSQLLLRCESVKRALSTKLEAPLVLKDAYVENGQARALNLVIDRGWAEPVWAPLLEQAAGHVDVLLQRAGWRADEVDQVVLIGGSSLVPAFQRTIEGRFPPERVVVSSIANVAVAIGATLVTGAHNPSIGRVPTLTIDSAA